MAWRYIAFTPLAIQEAIFATMWPHKLMMKNISTQLIKSMDTKSPREPIEQSLQETRSLLVVQVDSLRELQKKCALLWVLLETNCLGILRCLSDMNTLFKTWISVSKQTQTIQQWLPWQKKPKIRELLTYGRFPPFWVKKRLTMSSWEFLTRTCKRCVARTTRQIQWLSFANGRIPGRNLTSDITIYLHF